MTPIEAIVEGVKEIVDGRFEVSPWGESEVVYSVLIRLDGCLLCDCDLEDFPVVVIEFVAPYEEEKRESFDMRDAADLDRLFARLTALFGPGGAWS